MSSNSTQVFSNVTHKQWLLTRLICWRRTTRMSALCFDDLCSSAFKCRLYNQDCSFFQILDILFHLFESPSPTSQSITSLSIQSRGIITQMFIPRGWWVVWVSPGGTTGLESISIVQTAGEKIYGDICRSPRDLAARFLRRNFIPCNREDYPEAFRDTTARTTRSIMPWCSIVIWPIIFPRINGTPMSHCRVHKSPPHVPILCQLNPVQNLSSYLSHLVLSSHLRLRLTTVS
jgi:hypothetical protein